MEAVEDQERVRDEVRGHADVGLRHVDRHAFECRGSVRAQLLEEGGQRLYVLAPPQPDHDATLVINDDRDVLVVPPIAQLVDPDVSQTIEPLTLDLHVPVNDAADDGAEGGQLT